MRVTGTTGNESVELWPDHMTFQGAGFTVTTNHAQVVTVTGGGGSDAAIFHDSAGNDKFTATLAAATLSGPGFVEQTKGFKTLEVHAGSGGINQALLYGVALQHGFASQPSPSVAAQMAWLYDFQKVFATPKSSGKLTPQAVDSVLTAIWPAASSGTAKAKATQSKLAKFSLLGRR